MLVGVNGFWDDWGLRAKVTFDGPNRLILVNPGVTDLDFRDDVYTEWKQWVQVYDHMKYAQAITVVGGDPISLTVSLGATFFLVNGWKIRTWEGNHRLTVAGNVYCDDGTNQFVDTVGAWTITINLKVSNLIDQVYTDGGAAPTPSEIAEAVAAEMGPTPTPEQISDAVWLHSAAAGLQGSVGELLGLAGKNQVIDQVTADDSGAIANARLRTFQTPEDAEAGTDASGTYQLLLSRSAGLLSMVRMTAT